MKKFLKRVCLFICITITISMAVMPIATQAAENMSISVSDAAGSHGENVSVDINIGNNPGFNALNLAVVYDSANLTQTGVQNNVSALYMTSGSSLVWDGAENYTGNGSLATVTFSIAPDARVGEYEIKLVFWGASNEDFEEVPATISAGKITVTCKHLNTTQAPEDPASCNQGGYTAGVYCNTCKTYISGHEATSPTGQHVDADGAWEKDDAKHWHTCACGQIFGSEGHSGGTATCIAKAVCSACGKEYGTVNKENHAGKTTVINASAANHNTQTPGYTGDIKCNDCGEIITYGQPIDPAAHTPAANWSTDGTHHWKACSVSGCDHVFADTKTGHTSTGANQASCQKAAICDVCGATYGQTASHSYTAETKSSSAVKTGGDCCNEAVYYYSCSGCGAVENDDNHTFKGEKDKTRHVGGTTVINAVGANHNTQTPGYTGDTKCLGCQQIIQTGTTTAPTPHNPQWKNDDAKHWQVCTVSGCGVVIEGSTAEHSSSGGNVATCQKAAVCDRCGASYGTIGEHSWSVIWSSDESGHWYACVSGVCSEKKDFAAHIPDHAGGATEEHPVRCTECRYLIEAQLDHSHVYDQEVQADEYKASAATCSQKAAYYKTCRCGEKGTETFLAGDLAKHTWLTATCTAPKTCSVCGVAEGKALGHTAGGEWKMDASGHWKLCAVEGCGAVVESTKAAHIPDHTGGATEEYPIKCTVCMYLMENQLGHAHVYDQQVTASEYQATSATCTAKATYYKSCRCGDKGAETFEAGEFAAHVWTNATCTTPKTCTSCGAAEGKAVGHTAGGEWKMDASGHWKLCTVAGCGAVVESTKAAHIPDHTGGATEEYPIRCTECKYIMEAQLEHPHVYDQQVAATEYKATSATCTAKATYYKSCRCGDKGTETFEAGEFADHIWADATCTDPKTCTSCSATEGEALGHTAGSEWKCDNDNHWYVCVIEGCGEVVESSVAAHTPDRDAPTDADPVLCSVCGYMISPELGHVHTYGEEWKSQNDGHWTECDCGNKGQIQPHADEDENGECDICGYQIELPEDPVIEKKNNVILWVVVCVAAVAVVAVVIIIAAKKKDEQ